MRSGRCCKCQATNVYGSRNGLGLGRGAQVGLRPHLDPDFRGVAAPHNTADVWQFACTACGYTETYVLDADALEFIRRSWASVGQPDPTT